MYIYSSSSNVKVFLPGHSRRVFLRLSPKEVLDEKASPNLPPTNEDQGLPRSSSQRTFKTSLPKSFSQG